MSVPAQIPQRQPAAKPKPSDELARLAALHDEAQETARLANLLGRSLPIAAALALGAFAIAAANSLGATATLVWLMLVLAASAVILAAYVHMLNLPFERAALTSYREDLKAILLYAGFAWGAGAWMALPFDASAPIVIAFAALPVGAIAALVRDRDGAFLFGAPATGLVAFASVLRPFSGAALDAALILIACGAVGAAVISADRVARAAKSLPFFKDIQGWNQA